jgi:hypothetical protein
VATTPHRWIAFGARVALVAILAQAIIPTVHHIYHGYPPILAAVILAGEISDPAETGSHEHDPAKKHAPSPAPDNRTPICPVCQSAQQLTATLPPALAPLLVPPLHDDERPPARDSAAIAARLCSPAQPRAPPPPIA